MVDAILGDPGQGTASSADVTHTPGLQLRQTMTIEERARELTEQAGFLRNQIAVVTDDAAVTHLRSFRLQLDTRTGRLAKRDSVQLLNEVADLGFAWRISPNHRRLGARLAAAATRRAPNGANRRAIPQLLAFAQIITDQVFDPASWMEVPISSEAPATPIDLYERAMLISRSNWPREPAHLRMPSTPPTPNGVNATVRTGR